jgi:beta-galactosidase
LDEAGNATEKFRKFRAVIEKHLPAGQKLPAIPADKKTITINPFTLSENQSLFSVLPVPLKNVKPLTFEDLNQNYGYVLYRTTIKGNSKGIIKLKNLRDYALIFLNQKRAGILDRRLNQDSLEITLPEGDVQLDILVENMGRVNFGKYLLENKKGITEKVTYNGQEINNWSMYSLPFDDINSLKSGKIINDPNTQLPVIKKGQFELKELGDTYLDMRTWGKGVVWLNGHNLGKYWSIGPQQTIYVPKEWLRKGKNDIAVLELIKPGEKILKSISKPILNELRN